MCYPVTEMYPEASLKSHNASEKEVADWFEVALAFGYHHLLAHRRIIVPAPSILFP